MSNAPATEQIQKELASIANSFEQVTHPKWKELLPFKDSITELRKRGASFKTITTILRNKSIRVSHDTVARFWYELLGQKSQKRNRQRTKRKTENDFVQNRSQRKSNKAGARPPNAFTSPPAERGPRIARIEDL